MMEMIARRLKIETGRESTGVSVRADACSYHVSPPIEGFEYVWVSQANAIFTGWETYIFPADESGNVTDWGELDGSRRGYISPDGLMIELGYSIIE